jgi:hypothetical protein
MFLLQEPLCGKHRASLSGKGLDDLDNTSPYDTTVIHAYNASGLLSPPELDIEVFLPTSRHHGLAAHASNLFSQFSSYCAHQNIDNDCLTGVLGLIESSNTREPRLLDSQSYPLLGPMHPKHSGRVTLVLDLDGEKSPCSCASIVSEFSMHAACFVPGGLDESTA